MHSKQMTPDFSVSSQLSLDDVRAAGQQGFRAIIVNRPDNEEPGQPSIAAMRQAANAAGLGFAAVPVRPGHVTDQDVAQFTAALASLDGPVLGYCRTGTRAVTLWALKAAETLEPEAVLNAAAAAGHDLAPLRSRLAQRHADALRPSPSEPDAGDQGAGPEITSREQAGLQGEDSA